MYLGRGSTGGVEGRDVAGRVAVVTGAGRGIGRATAAALVEAGARVALGDLDAEAAHRAAAELGPSARGLALDVTDADSFAGFVEDAQRALGPIDIVVNNAGIMPVGPFAEEDPASTRRMVDINVHGVMAGMRLALPDMLARGHGHVVNVASVAGRFGFPGGVTYCGTKFFVMGASEALRAELRGSGVAVSCVLPGYVETELTSGLQRPPYIRAVKPEHVAEAIVETLRRPRFAVWVPRYLAGVGGISLGVPRPVREMLGRRMKADRFLLDFDHAARAPYEERAARSEPGV